MFKDLLTNNHPDSVSSAAHCPPSVLPPRLFHMLVDRMKSEAVRLGDSLGLQSLSMMVPELPADMTGPKPCRVSERCDVVQAVVQCLSEELIRAREEIR